MAVFKFILSAPPASIAPDDTNYLHQTLLSHVEGFEFGPSCNPMEAGWDRLIFYLPYELQDMFKRYSSRIFSGEMYLSVIARAKSANNKMHFEFVQIPRNYASLKPKPKLPPCFLDWTPTPRELLLAQELMASSIMEAV